METDRLMPRFCAFAVIMLLAFVGLPVQQARAVVQERHLVDLPTGTILGVGTRPVVTADGNLGFVAPVQGDTVDAFALRTGETLGRVQDLGVASGLSLHEGADARLLMVTLPGRPADPSDPSGAIRPASVIVLDVSDVENIAVRSTLKLADNVVLAPDARATFVRDGRFGLVTVVAPVPAVVSFDTATGVQVGALTLDGRPDSLAVSEPDQTRDAVVALPSSSANEVALVSLSPDGVLLPAAAFQPPPGVQLAPVNNVQFSADGRYAFVASMRGTSLMSLDVASGTLVDRISTEGTPAALSVYHTSSGERIAVSNISRPGSVSVTPAESAEVEPLGFPGTVIVDATTDGKFSLRSRFAPETGEDVAPANAPEFNADGTMLFVPTRTGSLYSVDVLTGQNTARQLVGNHVQSITVAPLAEVVAVVTAGGSDGSIEVIPAGDGIRQRAPQPEEAKPHADEPAPESKPAEKTQAPPVIDRLAPPTVETGRRKDLVVTVIGSGFQAGATVLAGSTVYSAAVNEKGRRASFSLPASTFTAPANIPVQLVNPDNSASNTVALAVVPPFSPILTKVSPDNIPSGSGGVDLRIRGDHFRDGAIAKVTFNDESGGQQTVDLRTYRLSFTAIVARLPYALTKRAKVFLLSIADRDGTAVSDSLPVIVAGPAITSVEPTGIAAGDLKAGETLVLKLTGTNLHRDAVVYVRTPVRGDNDTGNFVRVPSSNVQWKSTERVNVTLSAYDVAYSGPLIVRLFNPVAGLRPKQGDVAETAVVVSGPVVSSTTPGSIVAGTDMFILKLDGTDFRKGAMVKVQRDGGGTATRRIVVDDPAFKDRKRINVPFDTPELLRLVARPGTIFLRVLNPTLGKSDPSPQFMVPVVGPHIASFELIPRQHNPEEYRLTLTGTDFRDGATIQVLTSDGTPVGHPIDGKVKSDTEIVVTLSRTRVTNLRTFKVRVINSGGAYNTDGIASNDLDVTVE